MYKLLKTQKEFLEPGHDNILDVCVYQGGYGSGKTFIGSLLGIMLAEAHPGIRGLVGAQTYTLVRDTTLVSYIEHLEKLGRVAGVHYNYSKSEAKLQLWNKSEILFRHFDDGKSLKSLNLGFVEIEEMSDIPEATFHMLLGRLRQAGVPRYRLFGHTNPEMSKGWIFQNFIEKPKPNYRFIQAPTTENIYLPEGFVDNLKTAYDPDYYNINVLGNFGDYTKGLVVKGFSDENITDIGFQPDEPIHICCDFNVDPMCWALGHKTENCFLFFDEIVVEDTTTLHCTNVFAERYPDKKAEIIINGDASGDNRSANSEYTNYACMRNRLKELGYKNVKFDIRGSNPKIKNRIAAFNAKVRNSKNEVRLFVSNQKRNINGNEELKCKWIFYTIYNAKYKVGTSDIDEPTHHQIKSNKTLKYHRHMLDSISYPVEKYWPVRLKKDEDNEK